MGVRIQELPETTGINKEDVLIVEDGQGTKKGTVQQLDETLGVSQLKEDLTNEVNNRSTAINNAINIEKNRAISRENEIESLFTMPTQEAVNNWLNDHPEATTTVQEHSLTIDEMVIGTLGYVTPEMFGAVGDGVTDDTAAFNTMFNTNKMIAFFEEKTYYIPNGISNPAKVIVVGNNKSTIKCNKFLLNKVLDSFIRGINLLSVTEGNDEGDTYVFPNIVINTKIENINVKYFAKIFNSINTTSIILNSRFEFIKRWFCKNLVDSIIKGNYINAPKYTNPQTIGFMSVAHSTICHNFIDFFYRVFDLSSCDGINVVGNIFDVNYCVFHNYLNVVSITGNHFTNSKKRDTWDVSDNEDMSKNPWSVFKFDNLPNGDVVRYGRICINLSGNSYENDDLDYVWYDDTSLGNWSPYPTKFVSLMDSNFSPNKIRFQAYKSGNTDDKKQICIKAMEYREVNELPVDLYTFDSDIVVYNNGVYKRLNDKWNLMYNLS